MCIAIKGRRERGEGERSGAGKSGRDLGYRASAGWPRDPRRSVFISRVCRRVVSVLHSDGKHLESTCPTWHCCYAHKFGPVPSAEG